MNFKTLIAFSAALVCSSLWAVVTTGNTLCRIAVESRTKDTIISLPLVDVGGAGDSISITKMVLAENLSDGDTLMAKVDGEWQTWKLQNRIWEGAKTVNGDETISSSPNAAFNRGTAIILRRTGLDLSKPIYLYGEFKNAEKEQTPVAGGWTLMGNALPSDFKINKKDFWTVNGAPSKGDQLIVATSLLGIKEYTWGTLSEGTGWITAKMTKNDKGVLVSTKVIADDSIPAGHGFWYRSVGTSVPTVTWTWNDLNDL